MPTQSEVESLIIESVRLLAEDFEIDTLSTPIAETALYGGDGPLDSMALVNLIADVEDAIAETFGVSVALADEKAMSARNSPYRSVTALSEAAMERITEAQKA